MQKMHIYCSGKREHEYNTLFPHSFEVNSADDLAKAVKFDHICGKHTGNRRRNDTFTYADCLPLDCDNSHTDNPDEWITPEKVANALPEVCFYAVYSRNHMKDKVGKTHGSPRPRFHVYFPIDGISNAEEYKALKEHMVRAFPYFDACAKDASRLLFGVENPQVNSFDGVYNLTEHLEMLQEKPSDDVKGISLEDWMRQEQEKDSLPVEILEGSRNATMHRYASKFLMRYGEDDGQAHSLFEELGDRCVPPLDDAELRTIWNSAAASYRQYVDTHTNY